MIEERRRWVCYDHDCREHAYRDPACSHTSCTQGPWEPWMAKHDPVFVKDWPVKKS